MPVLAVSEDRSICSCRICPVTSRQGRASATVLRSQPRHCRQFLWRVLAGWCWGLRNRHDHFL